MKLNYKRITLISLPIIIILVIANVMLFYSNENSFVDKSNLKGIVTIQIKDVNGNIVSQTKSDTIYSVSYDMLGCVLWTICTNIGGLYIPAGTVSTITTTATLSTPLIDNFWTGLTLSSGTQSNGACSNILNTNGLGEIVASSVSHSVGTNQFTLTGSWTFSGSSQVVQSICLQYATENTQISQLQNVPIGGTTSLASENFASQTLTTGQSISVSWTFSF